MTRLWAGKLTSKGSLLDADKRIFSSPKHPHRYHRLVRRQSGRRRLKPTRNAHLVRSIGISGAIPPFSHAFLPYIRNKRVLLLVLSLNIYAYFIFFSVELRQNAFLLHSSLLSLLMSLHPFRLAVRPVVCYCLSHPSSQAEPSSILPSAKEMIRASECFLSARSQ